MFLSFRVVFQVGYVGRNLAWIECGGFGLALLVVFCGAYIARVVLIYVGAVVGCDFGSDFDDGAVLCGGFRRCGRVALSVESGVAVTTFAADFPRSVAVFRIGVYNLSYL